MNYLFVHPPSRNYTFPPPPNPEDRVFTHIFPEYFNVIAESQNDDGSQFVSDYWLDQARELTELSMETSEYWPTNRVQLPIICELRHEYTNRLFRATVDRHHINLYAFMPVFRDIRVPQDLFPYHDNISPPYISTNPDPIELLPLHMHSPPIIGYRTLGRKKIGSSVTEIQNFRFS